MFKKLFGKKEKQLEEVIYSPLQGKVVELEEVPDPTFSQKMMGDGVAIEPTTGTLVSPVDGEIIQLFHTKHALGIRSATDTELLIHIGLETVTLNGEGFEAHVKEGQKVKVGDKLITFDLDLLRSNEHTKTITPVVITNGDIVETLERKYEANGDAVSGETELFKIKVKE